MKKKEVRAKERAPLERSGTFDEVVSLYTEDEALEEAQRCLQCKDPTCIAGCPVNIDIKRFIREITKRDYAAAYFCIRETNNFASICGRICPAEYQCRRTCVFTGKGGPVCAAPGPIGGAGARICADDAIQIHFLERFVGDFGMRKGLEAASAAAHTGAEAPAGADRSVAVVGSGPAGLCCAGELARAGIRVTVYESLHQPGGVLRYGVPPFRLPRDVLDYEINILRKLGVTIVGNTVIGRSISLDELFAQGFAAVFLGLGAGVPSFLGVPGENLCNVYSANEFLTRINLMSAYRFPEFHTPINIGKKVVVIGGGNTAIDAARCALRLQVMKGYKPDTTILYRRTKAEMPARRLEISHAEEEGVAFRFLVQPVAFTGGNQGCVAGITCLQCSLGEKDASGRARPVAIKGSEFTLGCDIAVIAVGLKANRLLTSVSPELRLDDKGDIVVDPKTMETSRTGVFAGGDIVGGEGTVIEAMGMAKRAAKAIRAYLQR